MLPRLRAGDWLFVDPRPDRLRVGDLVVFRRRGANVAHRVLTLHPPREMGDAARIAGTFRADQVVGRVVAVVGERGTIEIRGWWARVAGRALAVRGGTRLVLRKLMPGRPAAPGTRATQDKEGDS